MPTVTLPLFVTDVSIIIFDVFMVGMGILFGYWVLRLVAEWIAPG